MLEAAITSAYTEMGRELLRKRKKVDEMTNLAYYYLASANFHVLNPGIGGWSPNLTGVRGQGPSPKFFNSFCQGENLRLYPTINPIGFSWCRDDS